MKGITKLDGCAPAGPAVGIGMIGYGFMGQVHSNAYVKIPYSFPSPAAHPELLCLRRLHVQPF